MWRAGLSLAVANQIGSQVRPSISGLSSILSRDLHLGSTLESRIKGRHTHKPFYHIKKTNKVPDEPLTPANLAFLREAVQRSFEDTKPISRVESPLKSDLSPWVKGEWKRGTTRCGLLGRKIGLQPMWYKNGKRVMATLIQIEDNHVVRYVPPELAQKSETALRRSSPFIWKASRSTHLGCLVVGALSADPSRFTKDYCGLFTESGLMPKKKLARFPVTENALIQPGTPLTAAHFDVGQFVDVRGRSCRRGFHGVMKRHGFSGMPSDARGVTKSHRRPGHVGSGRKGRIWPGQKMPGHMGGNYTIQRGLEILRINYEHNVLYVKGQAIAGEHEEFVQIFDCRTKGKDQTVSPKHFPTCFPEQYEKLPEEEYAPNVHRFEDPSIVFEPEEVAKKKKK